MFDFEASRTRFAVFKILKDLMSFSIVAGVQKHLESGAAQSVRVCQEKAALARKGGKSGEKNNHRH
jgi:hypothetical protein